MLKVPDTRGTVKHFSAALRLVKSERGFTLIELVILIILVGLLSAIVIPRYVDVEERAIRAEAQALTSPVMCPSARSRKRTTTAL